MKSSRRFDRSNIELGLKKPRLIEDPNRIDSANGQRYVPQLQQQQQQQHEELVIEYKRALAELTMNSKPIITNLTIIAGENLRAAKAITAVICGNILEIPSEQKLPSLYLLDSIVKNIGRDYIKYFAARLPEVFCKAYREVKPLVHPGMRRLFGTWRKVFPPQQLQLIEKELGFTTGNNGSSSGTQRDDLQAQPAHSMHINIEARQCLQQPIRVSGSAHFTMMKTKRSADDIIPADIEKPERAASVGSGRSWFDDSTKKDQLNGRVREKTSSAAFGDPEYASDLSRGSGLGLRITSEKFKEEGIEKSWYNSANGKVLSQRNGLGIKHGFQSLSKKSAQSGAYPQLSHSVANRSNTLMDRSWQNSEEEEYMWDDVNGVGKDQQTSEDSDKSGLDIQLPRHQSIQEVGLKADSEASADSLPGEVNGQASSGDQMSSMWIDGARHSASVRSFPDHPRTGTSSIDRKPFQSQKGSSHVVAPSVGLSKTAMGSRGPTKQQGETHRAVLPSSQSPMRQLPPSPSVSASNSSEVVKNLSKEYQTQTESHADPRIFQLSRRSNSEFYNKISQESLSKSQTAHLVKSQMSQTPKHNRSSLMKSVQAANNVPFPQNIEQKSPKSECSGHAQQSVVTQVSGCTDPSGTVPFVLPGSESPGKTSMSTLLSSILKSGVLGSKSSVGTALSSCDKGDMSAGAQPRPSGPSSQFLLSDPRIPPASVVNVQLDRNGSKNYSQRDVERPQLPHGPPSTLVDSSASLQTSSVSNDASDPVSKLLSSLVAKGLITASKEESPASAPSQTPPKSQIQSPPSASISSNLAVSAPVSLPVPFSSPNDEISLSKPAAKIPDVLLQSTKEEIKDLAGFAFKPGVIRESNPCVISELLDDVPHQCGICGLRLKLPVQLDRHLEWHTLRSPDGKLLDSERRWYLNSGEWISRTGSLPNCGMSAGPIEGSSKLSKCSEVMVPADEGQCICVLCGHLFEDYYDEEGDKWMFKGAVYMNSSSSESGTQSPIVHKNCTSGSSQIFRLTKDIKLELEA